MVVIAPAARLLTRPWLTSKQQQTLLRQISSSNTHLEPVPPPPHVDPKWSYAYGRSDEPLDYRNLGELFRDKVAQSPRQLGYRFAAEQVTASFGELDTEVRRAMQFMSNRLGLVAGDRVGVFAYNCFRWLVVQCACIQMGVTLVPVNPSYKSEELGFVLESARVRCLFMPGPDSRQSRQLNDHLGVLLGAPTANRWPEQVVLMNLDERDSYDLQADPRFGAKATTTRCQWHQWDELSTHTNPNNITCSPPTTSPEEPFAIYYTSGTTGKPKGACVSHFAAVNNLRLYQRMLRAGRARNWRMRSVTCLPLFHIYNGLLVCLGPLVSETEVIMPGWRYDVAAYARTLADTGANHTALTPTMLVDLLAHLQTDLHLLGRLQLRVISSGGAPLAPQLVDRAHRLLPHLEEVRIGYGSTENGGVATFQSPREPVESRRRSVGQPLLLTAVRVVDPKNGKLVELGQPGEIQTRGHNTMLGYLDEPLKTAEVLNGADRWYRTGDVGTMMPSGAVQVITRIKQLIIKGGENVYPEEVEQVILRLEHLVENCHVVGVPDERLGEQVCAWVKLKEAPTAVRDQDAARQEILSHCKRSITYFKVPRYVLFTADEFPMTPTKKVQKHLLTEMSIKILKLGQNDRRMVAE